MAKPMKWKGKTAEGQEIVGEAFDAVDVQRRAESMGCTEFTYEANPEYTDADIGTEEIAEVISHTRKDVLDMSKTDMQVLAEANATLFNQVDELKNKCAALEMEADTLSKAGPALAALSGKCEDLKTVILAWNTEQQAAAQAAGAEYAEPAFVELTRALV